MIYLPSSTQLPVRKSGHCTSQQGLGSSHCLGRVQGADQGTAFLLFISFKSSGNVFSTSCSPRWWFWEPCGRLKFEPRIVPRIPLTLPRDRCAGCASPCLFICTLSFPRQKRKCTINLEPTCCVYLPEDLGLVSLLIFWAHQAFETISWIYSLISSPFVTVTTTELFILNQLSKTLRIFFQIARLIKNYLPGG